MKLIDILQTANSNMFRSRLRTFLTIIAIFIGAFTLTLTNGIGAGVASYIDEQLGNIGAKDMLIIQPKNSNPFGESTSTPQKYEEGQSVTNTGGISMTLLNQNDLDKIRSTPGIVSADFDISVAPNFISGPNSDKFKFTASSYYDGVNISLKAGSIPNNHTDEKQILLTSDFPTVLGFESPEKAIGQNVSFGIKTPTGEQKAVTAKVVGVQEKTLMSMGGLQLNKPLINELYILQTEGLPADTTNKQPIITARFDQSLSDEQLEQLKKTLNEKGYNAITIEDQIGIIKQVIDAVIAVLNFFAGIALLAASFGIVNTLLMAVQERTKEIGLMKAMGMSSRKVFLLFSTEAMLLGFWGSLIGSLAGITVGLVANKVATDTFLKDLVGFELTSFPLLSIFVIMFIIMMIAFLAGTLPARRASKKDPIEALRYE